MAGLRRRHYRIHLAGNPASRSAKSDVGVCEAVLLGQAILTFGRYPQIVAFGLLKQCARGSKVILNSSSITSTTRP